jgi:hypothetical protein
MYKLDPTKLKITKELVPTNSSRPFNSGYGNENWYVNGILVLTNRVYNEMFCSIGKGGSPSNIRDKSKKACDSNWNRKGLVQLLGTDKFRIGSKNRQQDFNDDYPDTTWGYPGSKANSAYIREAIARFTRAMDVRLSNLTVNGNMRIFMERFGTPHNQDLAKKLAEAYRGMGKDLNPLIDLLLSNFGTISGYMGYSDEDKKYLQEQISEDQETVKEALTRLYQPQKAEIL